MPAASPAILRGPVPVAPIRLGSLLCALLLAGLALADPGAAPAAPSAAPQAGTAAPQAPAPAGPGLAPASPTRSPATPTAPPAAALAPAQPAAAAPEGAAEGGLDSDLVYTVLVAELAARRGDMAMAFTHYLHAAQLARDPKMAELAVRAALSGDDDRAAGRGVELWLKLAPDSVGANQIAALLRIKANDREGALTHLSRLVALAETDASAGYNQAAAIVGRMPDADARVALMQSLVDLHPDSADAEQALAMVAAAADKPDVAAAAARRALALRPDWSAPRTFLVRLLISEGKRGDARALLEQLVTTNPEDQALSTLYGQFLVEEKEYAKARAVFERLLKDQPQVPDNLFAAGILSLELDDPDAARRYFNRLYQTGERRDEASYYLGQVEERAKNPAAAIDWYSKTEGANEVEAQVRIAVLRALGGEVERAREIVQQLRDQSPDDARSLFVVESEILDEAGRPEDALAVYGQALKAYPDDQDLLYGRALYAVKRDKLALAEADLKKIIALNPEHADALNALGYTLADRTDRYAEALGYIERAIKLKPEEPAILDSMGWVQYRLGHPDVALDYLRRALDAMDDGEIAAHLGEVLWALERHDEARGVWDKALKAHADNPYLKSVVERHRVAQSERAQ